MAVPACGTADRFAERGAAPSEEDPCSFGATPPHDQADWIAGLVWKLVAPRSAGLTGPALSVPSARRAGGQAVASGAALGQARE